ncbi:MAG: CPBP family glutamic-type intramembrane protease [Eubacteriales bacterium]
MRLKNSTAAPLLIISVLALGIFFDSFYRSTSTGAAFFLELSAINLCVYVLPAIFYIRLKGKGYVPLIKLRPRFPVSLTVFTCLALIAGTWLLGSLGQTLFGAAPTAGYEKYVAQMDPVTGNLGVVLAFAIIPAACEELLFRGVVLAEYQKYGGGIAVVISAALFATIHFSLQGFAVYFLAGLLLGAAAQVSGSILPCFVIHALGNLSGIYGEDTLMRVLGQPRNTVLFTYLLGIVFLVLLMGMLSSSEDIYYKKAHDNVPSPVETDKKNLLVRLAGALISPTLAGAAALYLVYSSLH